MSLLVKNLTLVFIILTLVSIPMIVKQGAEFGGTDGKAQEAVIEVHPGYRPWFKPFWEPPSSEVESFLFALQAAVGSGFVFYCLGYFKGRKNFEKETGVKHAKH